MLRGAYRFVVPSSWGDEVDSTMSTLAYLCSLSLCWLTKKPFLCFSGCSRKKIKAVSSDQYQQKVGMC
ncbi:hypothetical protein ACOSQ3_000304 [Xanthoceras sorbifolium]